MSFVSPWGFSELVDSLIRAIASANMVPRLTANALLHSEETVKTQLEDWLEKPQRHEWLAVGNVASRYDAKTGMSHDYSGDDLSRTVSVCATNATGSLIKEESDEVVSPKQLQAQEWLAVGDVASRYDAKTRIYHDYSGEYPSRNATGPIATGSLIKYQSEVDNCPKELQGHEWLAVGDVSSPIRTETKATPEDNGEGLDGRMLAGVADSTIKREDHHLGDGTDKSPKHELLALRECGCHFPAKTDEFFADIDEILSGKTE